MRKEINIDDFERKFLLNNYKDRCNPFSLVTVKIDITKIVNYCKIHKNYYATIGYIIGKIVNEMDCFKYRLENNKIYKYDTLRIGYTNMTNDNNIGFYSSTYFDKYEDYITHYKELYSKFKNGTLKQNYNDHGEIWVSCEPWFEFIGLVPPIDSKITIPQFIWSKFYEEHDKIYTNLMIMVHHGFADGSHIGEFIEKLNNQIQNFNEIVK